jgi:hypothetical protein
MVSIQPGCRLRVDEATLSQQLPVRGAKILYQGTAGLVQTDVQEQFCHWQLGTGLTERSKLTSSFKDLFKGK